MRGLSDTPSKNIVLVPLGKLKKSPKNVRQVPHAKADLQVLAAIGMLQYPVVEPETGAKGKPTGFYLVSMPEKAAASRSKWRLEEWVSDHLFACKIGQRFDDRKDEVYMLLERRIGPIGAAIVVSIALPSD